MSKRVLRILAWGIPALVIALPLVAVLLTPVRERVLRLVLERAVLGVPGIISVESAHWRALDRIELEGVRWSADPAERGERSMDSTGAAPGRSEPDGAARLIASVDRLRLDVDLFSLRKRWVIADTVVVHVGGFDLRLLQQLLASLEKAEPRAPREPSGPPWIREIDARWIDLRVTRAAIQDSLALDELSIRGAFRMRTAPQRFEVGFEQGGVRIGTARVDSLSGEWSSSGALVLRASGSPHPDWPLRLRIDPLPKEGAGAAGAPQAADASARIDETGAAVNDDRGMQMRPPLLLPARIRVWLDRPSVPERARDWSDSTTFAILDLSIPSPMGEETLVADLTGRIEDLELAGQVMHTPRGEHAWLSVQGSGLALAHRIDPGRKLPEALLAAIQARVSRDSLGLAAEYIGAAAFRQGETAVDRADLAGWLTLENADSSLHLGTELTVHALGFATATRVEARRLDELSLAVDPVVITRFSADLPAISIESSPYAASGRWDGPAAAPAPGSVRNRIDGLASLSSGAGPQPASVVIGKDGAVVVEGLQVLGDLGVLRIDGSLSRERRADVELRGVWEEPPLVPAFDRRPLNQRREVARRWGERGPFDLSVRASLAVPDPLNTVDATLQGTLPGPHVLAPLWPARRARIDSLGTMGSLRISAELAAGSPRRTPSQNRAGAAGAGATDSAGASGSTGSSASAGATGGADSSGATGASGGTGSSGANGASGGTGSIHVNASGEGWLDQFALRGSWSGSLTGPIPRRRSNERAAAPSAELSPAATMEAAREILRTWLPSTISAVTVDTLLVDGLGARVFVSGSSGSLAAWDTAAESPRFAAHVVLEERSVLVPMLMPPRLHDVEASVDLQVELEAANGGGQPSSPADSAGSGSFPRESEPGDRLLVRGGGSFDGLGVAVPQVTLDVTARLAGSRGRSLYLPAGLEVPLSGLQATVDLPEGLTIPSGSVKGARLEAEVAPFLGAGKANELTGLPGETGSATGPSGHAGSSEPAASRATVKVTAEGIDLATVPPGLTPERVELVFEATSPESLTAQIDAGGFDFGPLRGTSARISARTTADGVHAVMTADEVAHGSVQLPWRASLESFRVARLRIMPHGDSLHAQIHMEGAPVPLGREAAMSRYLLATGDLEISGTLSDPRAHAEVTFALPEEKADHTYRAQVDAELGPEGLASNIAVLEGENRVASANAELPLEVSLYPWSVNLAADTSLSVRVDAPELDLEPFTVFLPEDMTLSGIGRLNLVAEGALRDPGLDGKIELERLELEVADGTKVLLGGALDISGSARTPEVKGKIELTQGTIMVPEDVKELHPARGDALLWSLPSSTHADTSGSAEARGSGTGIRPRAPGDGRTGDLPPEATETEAAGPPAPATAARPLRPSMDVTIVIPNGLWIRGRNLDIELGGELRLDQTEMLHVTGTLRALRGQYRLLGRTFEVEQGVVHFYGEDELDPALDISVTCRLQDIVVRVSIYGTVKQPELVLTSEPPMEQGDILSYLVLGRPVDDLDEDQVGLVQERATEIATLFGTTRVEGALEKLFGFDLVSVRQGTGPDEGSALIVGKYLSPRILLKYEQGLSTDSGSFLNLEYLLTRWLRLESLAGEQQSGVELNWAMDY